MKKLSMMPKSCKMELSKRLGLPVNERKKKPKKVDQEIKELQRSTALIIPCNPFVRIVKQIIEENTVQPLRTEKTAIRALQEASESFLVSLFEEGTMVAHHCKRVTVTDRDLRLALRLKSL